jgi:hypothetical protein
MKNKKIPAEIIRGGFLFFESIEKENIDSVNAILEKADSLDLK